MFQRDVLDGADPQCRIERDVDRYAEGAMENGGCSVQVDENRKHWQDASATPDYASYFMRISSGVRPAMEAKRPSAI
jgi:hypothetical protein